MRVTNETISNNQGDGEMTTKVQITVGDLTISIVQVEEDLTLDRMMIEVIKPLLLALQYSPKQVDEFIPEVEE